MSLVWRGDLAFGIIEMMIGRNTIKVVYKSFEKIRPDTEYVPGKSSDYGI